MASKQTLTTDRIETFSDAVFAIAVTFLALQLALPAGFTQNPSESELLRGLLNEAPSYFSFILSFIVIGQYWIAHRQLFSHIERGDVGLASVNLLLLLSVVAIPFPTQLLGEYGDLAASTIFYALSLSLVGLMNFMVWRYAVRHKLIRRDVSKDVVTSVNRRSLIVPVVFLLSVPIALVDVNAAQWFWLVAFVAALVIRKTD